MFLLNLSLAEFLTLLGAISGLVVALYLLDRSRRRLTVATLRFWVPAQRPAELRSRRRRIQQPLSLLLQIFSLACLLLAVAQPRLGVRESGPRDHVLILDTSAWMDARAERGTLMDEGRAVARSWLRTLPANDRVMLIRADGLATPATVFEQDRKLLEEAINRSQAGATALDIDQALNLARQVLELHAARIGEIVFAGAGRISERGAGYPRQAPDNLRVLPVATTIDNCGLRRIGLRRSVTDPAMWEIFVSVRNFGATSRSVALALQFGGAPVGARRLELSAGSEQNVTFELRTRAAGWLEARLLTADGFPGDDRALLELPRQKILRVEVYSDTSRWLRPVLAANPNVEAQFRRPSEYKGAPDADIVILDGFRPESLPAVDSIWIEPPEEGSPFRVRTRLRNALLSRWRSDQPLATGLRVQDLRLESTLVFAPAQGDISVAEVDEGPVLLARPGKPRMVVLGFHPVRSSMRYQLATPLMFANILRWMEPEIFRRWELSAGSVGSITTTLDPDIDTPQVRVLSEDQTPLPFTIKGSTLRFFARTPGTVRVLAGDRESVYSLTLPEVAGSLWELPRTAMRGIPASAGKAASSRDLWRLLAVLGGVALLADWLLFGKERAGFRRLGSGRSLLLRLPRFRSLVANLVRKAS